MVGVIATPPDIPQWRDRLPNSPMTAEASRIPTSELAHTCGSVTALPSGTVTFDRVTFSDGTVTFDGQPSTAGPMSGFVAAA